MHEAPGLYASCGTAPARDAHTPSVCMHCAPAAALAPSRSRRGCAAGRDHGAAVESCPRGGTLGWEFALATVFWALGTPRLSRWGRAKGCWARRHSHLTELRLGFVFCCGGGRCRRPSYDRPTRGFSAPAVSRFDAGPCERVPSLPPRWTAVHADIPLESPAQFRIRCVASTSWTIRLELSLESAQAIDTDDISPPSWQPTDTDATGLRRPSPRHANCLMAW